MPSVDVILPVYNAQQTLQIALESLLQQSLQDILVFAIDDGSTDCSPEILRAFARADRRLRVITQANGGIVAALNKGLKAGSSPYVARLDADDIADRDRLLQQKTYLETNPDCVALSSFARHIDESGRTVGTLARFPNPAVADPLSLPAREPYLLHPFLMAKRSALEDCHGYRAVINAEDSDLYWRLRERGRLHIIPEVMGSYRLSAGGISSKSTESGRILSAFSQLAAVSAQRRRSCSPDLEFDLALADLQPFAKSSEALTIYLTVHFRLSTPESLYFKRAFCAKLLELTSYRPYELTPEDCDFIAKALDRAAITSSLDKRVVGRARAIAVARLSRKGQWHSALRLLTISTAGEALLRRAFRS